MIRLAVAVVGMLLGLAAVAGVEAQGEPAAPIEVRVWQDVGDELDIYVSARPAAGSWRTLGTISLALDDGISATGRFRYGDIDLDVPLLGRADPATVEVRVWQDVGNSARVYISARPADGDWGVFGTIRLPLDDGVSSSGRFRNGNVRLDVPLPPAEVATLAGQAGVWGYVDGRGSEAQFGAGGLSRPYLGHLGLAVDRDGSVVVADRRAVRRILPDGTVTTIAGGSTSGNRDGPAATARFQVASDVAIHPDGSIYVADWFARRIRKITPDGMVVTVAGGDPPESETHVAQDEPERVVLSGPSRLALAPDGGLYVMERGSIKHLSPSGHLSRFVGGGPNTDSSGWKTQVGFVSLRDIDVDAEGNLYVLDGQDYGPYSYTDPSYRVRKVATDGWVSTVFQSHTRSAKGLLVSPDGLAVTNEGEVYLANTARNQIVRVAGPDTLEAVAGTGADGFLDGDRGTAQFSWPGQLAVLPGGALLVTDQANSVVRVVFPEAEGFPPVALAPISELPRLEGVHVSALAGRGGFGSSSRGYQVSGFVDGPGEEALFHYPRKMALEADGSVIVADNFNHAIRRISPDGTVTTIAGGNGRGDRDGPGDVAQFDDPWDVAVGPDGSIYVADTGNDRVRRIAPDGTVGPVEEKGSSISPGALAVDPEGNLLIVEDQTLRVLRVAPHGEVSFVAAHDIGVRAIAVSTEGTVSYATSGSSRQPTAILQVQSNGAVSTLVEDFPGRYGGVFSAIVTDLAVGPDGTLYAVDSPHGRVVRISTNGEAAIVADSFFHPQGILITSEGNLIVSDQKHIIWKITLPDE